MTESTASQTRETILATALQLFTVQGYDATSLRQIADRLGFTKAALYYHFPAKEHLAVELVRPWLDAVSGLLISAGDEEGDAGEDTTRARRTKLLNDYVDLFILHHKILRFVSQDPAATKHPDVGKRARALILALQDQLAGPDPDDADRVRIACAFGAVHAVALLDESTLASARPIVVSVALSVLGLD